MIKTLRIIVVILIISASCKDKAKDEVLHKHSSNHKIESNSTQKELSFLGLLGRNNIVRMKFFLSEPSLEGSCKYNNNQDSLLIKGYQSKDSIVLNEYYNGEKTGEFKGTLSDESILKGVWISPKKNKRIPFNLRELNEINKYQVNKKNCNISIHLSENNLFMIKSKKDKVGRYNYSIDGEDQYLDLGKISGLFYNDTLIIQNYGNSMNSYTHFDECDLKYITFVKTP